MINKLAKMWKKLSKWTSVLKGKLVFFSNFASDIIEWILDNKIVWRQ
jgi:hypothetical protein